MRLRYVAAAGPDAELARLGETLAGAGETPLCPILRTAGLSAWITTGTPWLGDSGRGRAVAIGLLFDRATGVRLAQLSSPLPPASEWLRATWGVYVLLNGDDAGGHSLLRDPSGGVGAYHRRTGALDVYASDAALLAAASREPLRPDWDFLRQWLTFPFLRAGPAGAVGVEEILPGAAQGVSGGKAFAATVWSPWDHARPGGAVADFDDAAALLRQTILRSVACLASPDGDLVVQLSGGLDSSIVAAALAAAGRRFRAVTFATRAPDGDERTYARAVARRCGIELAEFVEDDLLPDFERIPPLSLRPPANALLQPLHRALANHLSLTGADQVFDGAGGDNVFCSLNSASPALDAFRRRGPARGMAALEHLARLHGTTYWAVARAAWRRARRRPVQWRRDTSFLAAGAAAEAMPDHPWLDHPERFDRGTYEQAQSIVGIRHFLPDATPGVAATIHPLLAQPVVEACLRVPSWLWVEGGRDRAVARAAFAGLLPDAILARRAKGGLVSMYIKGYMQGRGRLESLLLDGRLAEAGLLNREAVCAYLRRDEPPRDAGYIRLLELASAETWLRSFDE